MTVEALIQIVAPLPTAIPVIAVFPVTLAVAVPILFALPVTVVILVAVGPLARHLPSFPAAAPPAAVVVVVAVAVTSFPVPISLPLSRARTMGTPSTMRFRGMVARAVQQVQYGTT